MAELCPYGSRLFTFRAWGSSAMKLRFEEALKEMEKHGIPGHIIHGDAHPGNFFIDGEGKIARSAGSSAEVVAQESGYTHLKMPSSEVRKILNSAWAKPSTV